MHEEQWMGKVSQHQNALRSLINRYHPHSRGPRPKLRITAPRVEIACELVRERIVAEVVSVSHPSEAMTPAELFDLALRSKDPSALHSLISETWFGVPESTDCWQLDGFRECVALLDDPPDCSPPDESV